ncbi:MAG: aminotransferase class III-fold pyridoxal phosphate-dependent enzyme, partial [Steroidobacteraceae bacterium]
APLDDEAALEAVFERIGSQIAGAIVEPLPANYGLLPQRRAWLERLAALCRKHGSLLIFDEVITGFRLGFQGFAGVHGFEPDLVTYGKVIGGGFPVGAYGGKREYMELVAPVGPVYQAGTLSANPVAMNAGLAVLRQLEDGSVYSRLETLGQRLETAFAAIPGVQLQREGSLFWFHLSERGETIRSLSALTARKGAPFAPLFHRLLDGGIYLAPSAFEVGFLSTAHTEAHVDTLAAAVRAALTE